MNWKNKVSPCLNCGHICSVERILKVSAGEPCEEQYNRKTGFVKVRACELPRLCGFSAYCLRIFGDEHIVALAKQGGFELKITKRKCNRRYWVKEL